MSVGWSTRVIILPKLECLTYRLSVLPVKNASRRRFRCWRSHRTWSQVRVRSEWGRENSKLSRSWPLHHQQFCVWQMVFVLDSSVFNSVYGLSGRKEMSLWVYLDLTCRCMNWLRNEISRAERTMKMNRIDIWRRVFRRRYTTLLHWDRQRR